MKKHQRNDIIDERDSTTINKDQQTTQITFEMNGKSFANDWMVISHVHLCMSSISLVTLEKHRL